VTVIVAEIGQLCCQPLKMELFHWQIGNAFWSMSSHHWAEATTSDAKPTDTQA